MPSRSTEENTGGSPNRPRRSTTTVRDGPGRGTDAPVEEGEGRSRGTADDGARAGPFGVSSSELQGVDVIDERERQWFTELG